MNLVAHYEAQMRDHLAAFTHAAAGAAWAAAQVASMSNPGAPMNDSQMEIANAGSSAAATAAAAAAAAASSAVSQLQQQSLSPPIPYVPHDPNMPPMPGSMNINPMNTSNNFMSPLYASSHPHTMHMQMPHQPFGSIW